jgi:hypothetical protein
MLKGKIKRFQTSTIEAGEKTPQEKLREITQNHGKEAFLMHVNQK